MEERELLYVYVGVSRIYIIGHLSLCVFESFTRHLVADVLCFVPNVSGFSCANMLIMLTLSFVSSHDEQLVFLTDKRGWEVQRKQEAIVSLLGNN